MNESYYVANVRARDWTRVLNVALAALLAGVLVFSSAQTVRLNEANARNNAVVQKAFYETCELTEGMSANYRKLLVAGDAAQMQVLLGEISRQTQGAAGNLALLPLGEETVSATIKFINQAEDFAETLDVVERVGFDSAFTFLYSKRSGTPAAKMENQVDEKTAKERFDRLLALVQEKAKKSCARFEGQTLPVLVEMKNSQDESLVTGRLANNITVHFPGDESLIGQIVNVRLLKCHGFYYLGEPA